MSESKEGGFTNTKGRRGERGRQKSSKGPRIIPLRVTPC